MDIPVKPEKPLFPELWENDIDQLARELIEAYENRKSLRYGEGEKRY